MGRPTLAPVRIPGYEYLDRLGQGSMGSVHLCRQQFLDRLAAVKVFHLQPRSSEIAAFEREAQILARLEHPGIISIYGAGLTAAGEPFIAMQYCSGPSLDRLVAEGPISVETALTYGVAISEAAGFIHARGVFHGDIKPANVLTDRDEPYLSDFGSARFTEVDGDVQGVSVPWAAPEVLLNGKPISAASDVYGLAATIWTLLAGRPRLVRPNQDNSMAALVQRLKDDTPDAMPRGGVPDRVLRALEDCMSWDPKRRPTPGELQNELLSGLTELASGSAPNAESPSLVRQDAGIHRTWGRTMLRSVVPVALDLAALNVDTLAPPPNVPAPSKAHPATQLPRAGTVAVLTAVPAELVAVRSHLRQVTIQKSSFGSTYAVGQFVAPDRRWRVACACIGPGNYSTALIAQQTLLWLQPDLIAFVGIAGGIKDVAKGDVVVATKVIGYEAGKDASEFLPRPPVFQTDSRLIQHFGMLSTEGRWRSRIPHKFRAEPPNVHVKPIIAGEKVLANRRSTLVRDVRRNHSDAVAVEMEGLGLYSAAAYTATPALAVRGISDLLSGKGARNDVDWQPRAAASAAALFFAGLAGLAAADFRRVAMLDMGIEADQVDWANITSV